MILHRCFPWDRRAADTAPGGALWFPRPLQGDGRHDAPERYGCMYVSEEPVAAVVEQLACLAGTSLAGPDLRRGGLPLALAALRLDDALRVVDLDEPLVLAAEGLKPSAVATGERALSQGFAAAIHDRRERVAGIRWWSAFHSRWTNVTLYDRALAALTVDQVRPLSLDDELVGEAARFLGLRAVA